MNAQAADIQTLTNIEQLNNVTLTSPVNGQVLIYDNGTFINTTLSLTTSLDSLTDVTITAPADGEVIRYDSVSGEWLNADVGDIAVNEVDGGSY